MAYNANKITKIVKERDKAENWLDFFQIKHQRNPTMRPMTKVPLCKHVMLLVVAVHLRGVLCSFYMSSNEFDHVVGSSSDARFAVF